MWAAVLLLKSWLNSNFRLINGPPKRTPLYRWFKSNLDKGYTVTSSKYQPFDLSHVTISKMWTPELPVKYSLNSTFWLINSSKKTPSYRSFKPNLDKSYEVTSTKY